MTTFNWFNVVSSATMLIVTVIGLWAANRRDSSKLGVELLVQGDEFIVRVTNTGRQDVQLSRTQIVWRSRFSLQTFVLVEFRPQDGGTMRAGQVRILHVSISAVSRSLLESHITDKPYVEARVITSLDRFYLSQQRILLDL